MTPQASMDRCLAPPTCTSTPGPFWFFPSTQIKTLTTTMTLQSPLAQVACLWSMFACSLHITPDSRHQGFNPLLPDVTNIKSSYSPSRSFFPSLTSQYYPVSSVWTTVLTSLLRLHSSAPICFRPYSRPRLDTATLFITYAYVVASKTFHKARLAAVHLSN